MHEAIQSFFVVQVAIERAFDSVAKAGQELCNHLFKEPIRHTLQELIGSQPPADLEKVHLEIESIRAELRGLRTDLREIQLSQTQNV
jgi:hypothetical protein